MVVPHWNTYEAAEPLGFTVPFRVAELVVMLVAEPVVTVGSCAFALLLKATIIKNIKPRASSFAVLGIWVGLCELQMCLLTAFIFLCWECLVFICY